MPAKTQNKVAVACPHCGHAQAEAPTAYSTFCQKCRHHYRVQDVLNPPPKAPERVKEIKRVTCFQCGSELEAPVAAQSTMCKRCSTHVDLRDYSIDKAVSKNFRTRGRLSIEEDGFVFNTDSVVSDAVIKGRFHGRLVAEQSLEIRSTADIKGNFRAGRLVIPAGNCFRWKEELAVGDAEIFGELAANLCAEGTVTLKSTARFFGDVRAKSLVVENGAVFVGTARIGQNNGA